jgi:hypothetical protein
MNWLADGETDFVLSRHAENYRGRTSAHQHPKCGLPAIASVVYLAASHRQAYDATRENFRHDHRIRNPAA